MNWLQQPWLETLGWTLLHSLWELSAIAAIAFLALLIVRRHSSHLRYAIAYALLVLMMATTLGTYAYLWSHRPYPIPLPTSANITPPAFTSLPITIESLPLTIVTSAPTLRDRALGALHLIALYAASLYLAGAAFVALRLFACYAALRRLRASALATPDHQMLLEELRQRLHITKPVQLLHSPHVEVPAVLGAWRPLILLPLTAATGLSTDHVTCLLLHELAHIRRHDYFANLVQSVIETLLFYHPAVIWLSAHIRQEREHCCDDVAIANSNRAQYAAALVSMESLRASPVLAIGASGGSLLQRIRRILNAPTPRSARHRLMSAASIVTAALFITLFALYLAACSRNDAPQSPTTSASPTSAAAGSALLSRHVNDFVVDGTLEEAINQLREREHLTINVKWDVLEAAGVARSSHVDVHLHDVTLDQALSTLLASVSVKTPLEFVANGDGITIATHDELLLSEPQVDQQFDIRALELATARTDSTLDPAIQSVVKQPRLDNTRTNHREEVAKQVITDIEQSVDPNSWKDHGGKVGEIVYSAGILSVHQTERNMAETSKILQLMEEAHQLQISIETRVMMVDDDLFKKFAAAFPALTGGAPQPEGSVLIDALSSTQLNDLLKMTQESADTVSVSTPRVTLFSGQTATIMISREQGFVSSGEKGLPARGQPSKVDSGIFITVTAAVSADRKSVAGKVDLAIRTLLRMDTTEEAMVDGKKMTYQTPVLDTQKSDCTFNLKSKDTGILGGMLVTPPRLPEGVEVKGTVAPRESRHVIVLIRPTFIESKETENAMFGPSTPAR